MENYPRITSKPEASNKQILTSLRGGLASQGFGKCPKRPFKNKNLAPLNSEKAKLHARRTHSGAFQSIKFQNFIQPWSSFGNAKILLLKLEAVDRLLQVIGTALKKCIENMLHKTV